MPLAIGRLFERRSLSRLVRRRGMPLRRRLLISSLLGTIPLILLGFLLLYDRYASRRDLLLAGNRAQSRLAAAYTQGWLEGQVRTLRTLAQSIEVQEGNPAVVDALLARQLRAQPDWNSLAVADAGGQLIANSNQALISIGDRDYFRVVKRTRRPFVSNILLGRITQFEVVAIAYPVISSRGAFRGAVVAGIRPDQLQHIFDQVVPDTGVQIALWGNDRRLIARSNATDEMIGQPYTASDAERIFSGKTGAMNSRDLISGERVLIGYAPVPVAGWTVMTVVPRARALSPVEYSMIVFTVLSALIMVISIFWSFYSANVVARQIARLAESAREIGAGKLETRVTMPGGDEISDLGESLNAMANDLQVIDRLKSDLLNMVSHELKTPLTSIRTSLQMLDDGGITPEHPRYQEVVKIAERQARRLQDMIENLLSVARMETGSFAVMPRATNLNKLVASSVELYDDMATARGLTITLDAREQLQVMADPPKIALVMNNLLDNAVKFTEHGSIAVRVQAEAHEANVTITDTGLGLSPEVRAHLFELFYQGREALLTRKAGGAGLGLVTVRAIIEQHGGRVFAESEGPGTGSTFGFTLPLADPA